MRDRDSIRSLHWDREWCAIVPPHSGYRLLVSEFAEEIRVGVGLIEDVRELLLLLRRLVLLLPVVQQHVHLADQQGLGVLKLCKGGIFSFRTAFVDTIVWHGSGRYRDLPRNAGRTHLWGTAGPRHPPLPYLGGWPWPLWLKCWLFAYCE